MACLSKIEGGFVLDCAGAAQMIVGADHLPQASLPADALHALSLFAPDRLHFIAGLLRGLNHKRPLLLAPSREILSRFDQAPPEITFTGSSEPFTKVQWAAEDPLCSVLTSGTSGTPQEFGKTARQLLEEALALAAELDLSDADTALATTASHHVYGLLFGILAPWAGGSRIVAHSDNEPSTFHPQKTAALAGAHGATILITVPAHLRALLESPVELPSVRRVVCSAAPLRPEDAKRFEERFGIEVTDVLGSTETGGIALRRPASSSAWRPLPGVRVALNGDERLIIHSPFLPDQDRPSLSDERAKLNEDGTFEHLGRADGIVKVGGKRISLQEIERIAGDLPGVTGALALSRSVPSLRGQELLLVVSGTHLEKKTIKSALRGLLEPIFVPRKIRIVATLPVDERGKVKRTDAIALFDSKQTAAGFVESKQHLDPASQRFVGHFDGDPLLPALAQLSDLILPQIREAFGGGTLVELVRVKWTLPLRPGSDVVIRLRKKKKGIHFEIFCRDQLSCSGTAKLAEPPGCPR